MALFISNREVAQLLPMKACIDALEEAFIQWGRGSVANRPRTRIRLSGGFLHYMAAAAPEMGLLGLRTYTTFTGGGQNLFLLYDDQSGRLVCLLESGLMSTIRTGAASGLATRHMARPEASTVGIIGTGGQAAAQLEAICAVRPIEQAKIFSRTSEKRQAFASSMAEQLGIEATPVDSAEECVHGVDIVVTITDSREPVLKGEWLSEGVHINAAGSNHWMRRELDNQAVERCDVIVVDDLEDAQIECGELIWVVERGNFHWDKVHQLRDVLAGRVEGRPNPSSITLFESQGLAMEDVAAARYVYQLAKERGVGQELPF